MERHIIVCIKAVIAQVPEKWVVRAPDVLTLNPFDQPALEMALRIRDGCGGTVTAISMGPESASFSLSEAMAMGVDRGILVCDPALAGSDTLATSTALAAAIGKAGPFDLLLFGARTADSDTGQVGPQTAVLLHLPLVTGVFSIEQRERNLLVERRADGFQETFEVSLPAALTIHHGSVQPRDLALSGIEKAFEEGEVEKWGLSKLELAPDQVGWSGSATRVASWTRMIKEKKCEFLSGAAEEQADDLVERLVKSGLIG
jgi:electron transfer flavoprotein beta subunit